MALFKKLHFILITFIFYFNVDAFSQELDLQKKNILIDKTFLSNLVAPSNKSFFKVLDDQDYKEFFVVNFEKGKYDTVIGKIMAVSKNTIIWVDTVSLNKRYVTAHELDILMEYLETRTDSTSHNSSKGIIQLVKECFGEIPIVDNSKVKGQWDDYINFLLTDIKDGFTENNEYIPGYFNPYDFDINLPGSNGMNLIYIDTYPGICYQEGLRNVRRILPTVAHELQHLIHWNYDPYETPFIDEGMSFLAEIICGFKPILSTQYFNNIDISLFDWNENNKNINESRATLFSEYLKEQCGIGFIKYLVSNTNTGKSGIDSALVFAGIPMTFEMLFTNWSIANYVDNKNIDNRYGYNFKLNSKPPARVIHINPNLNVYQKQRLNPLAPMYIKYTKGESLTANFNFNTDIIIKSLEIGNSNFSVYDVRTNYAYSQDGFGSIYNDIVFLCISFNDDDTKVDSVEYISTGKETDKYLEIFYDDGEPEIFGLSDEVGVKRFVRFRMPVGKILDSVRFAFKTTGDFLFHLYRTTDTSITDADIIRAKRISVRDTFPVWTNVDLTNDKIIPNYDIAAGCETLMASSPHPILWADNTVVSNRSIIYSPSREEWSPVEINYFIRAYLSDIPLNIEKKPDIIPENFKLYQNYPNPFNGMTTIEFDLKKRGSVKLKLFDLLGSEVVTLVDNNFDIGRYSIKWDGKNKYGVNVSTGMYIYSLENFGEKISKKLIYLR